jgi:hypothetical protein
MSDDDPGERDRVFSRIAPIILQFKDERPQGTFHVEELREYVLVRLSGEIAPDSPGRILRELRLQGMLDYVVINRRQSLYQFRPIDPAAPPPANPDELPLTRAWFDEAKRNMP